MLVPRVGAQSAVSAQCSCQSAAAGMRMRKRPNKIQQLATNQTQGPASGLRCADALPHNRHLTQDQT